ncbi:raptor, partial [Phlyctochytrium arcticum]
EDWRMRERLKTVSVALVLCLNIGVDPPDIVKPNPCARLECWVDPASLTPRKALEAIGRNLQTQYEVWQPRARYRLSLDPSVDELKKLCCSLRRNTKEERVLFHYNGHGVPRPTPGGELWVFNKDYTQYIPVSIYDLQTWLGSPCIYVYDCSNAGNILNAYQRFAQQRDSDIMRQATNAGTSPNESLPAPMSDCIQLAACAAHESLPLTPELPADVFTACLTTPIEIGLRWFITQNPLLGNITPDMVAKIPGRVNDRRTPLGELNWIFTAVTDTIAWNSLPHELFKRLFRQDLMVAALSRNFLLAERIMRCYRCTPATVPALPPTYQHPLWLSWDLAVDSCFTQLPALLAAEKAGKLLEYEHSSFFAEQLTAFEVWLAKGAISGRPPEQLPIILQVLLSQVHRLRALILLSKFLDLGPWAVNLALSVGIYPYVLKLLQSPAIELRPVLVFIWAKVLAVEQSCQNDLFKDNGFAYFVNILSSPQSLPALDNISEHKAMCAFILSSFCNKFPPGQQACLKRDLVPALESHLNDPDPLLRQWAALCLAKFWENNLECQTSVQERSTISRLLTMKEDPVAEVRAAALCALGTFITPQVLQDGEELEGSMDMPLVILQMSRDESATVRLELVSVLSKMVHLSYRKILASSSELLHEERRRTGLGRAIGATATADASKQTHSSLHLAIWKTLLILSVDSSEEVYSKAARIVDHI